MENSPGSTRVQSPPGLRKSGMPDSVLIPAPVSATGFLALARLRATCSITSSMLSPCCLSYYKGPAYDATDF